MYIYFNIYFKLKKKNYLKKLKIFYFKFCTLSRKLNIINFKTHWVNVVKGSYMINILLIISKLRGCFF